MLGQYCTYRVAEEFIWKKSLRDSVKRVKGLLNRKPRKTLKYVTPTEVFFWEIIGSECCVSELNFLECINSVWYILVYLSIFGTYRVAEEFVEVKNREKSGLVKL